jgi:class 3 adenylate cyclase
MVEPRRPNSTPGRCRPGAGEDGRAARAVRCGAALVAATAALDLAIRVGIHSGDVEIGGTGGVRGLAVNTAARVLALASSGEVLVSSMTRDLAWRFLPRLP